ncbi:MAG: DegV family protein [Lachnospiraceae bacterium]|nr:DegV family protein [Lachnospiraceae bacterium]
MAKIAIITDSNSGLSQEEAKELGVFMIPMPFEIDGKEYLDGINLERDAFYEFQTNDSEIFTSQPAPQTVMDLWDEVLKEYDEIIHIPMSSGLSSSLQTAKMLADDYDGKVYAVDNQRISVTMVDSIVDAMYLRDKGLSAKEIGERLESEGLNSSIYITLDTLKYLKKGGRITPAAAAIGTLLKIKPVLQIQGEKLDAFAKVRTMSAAKSIMINAVKSDVAGRISENGKYKYVINIAHTNNLEAAQEFEKEIRLAIPEYKGEIRIMELSLSVTCHIGPGALALAVSRVVE